FNHFEMIIGSGILHVQNGNHSSGFVLILIQAPRKQVPHICNATRLHGDYAKNKLHAHFHHRPLSYAQPHAYHASMLVQGN
ncbi:hypothetical protein, partial [Paenibacillus ehimensis]|uniref:hypothetical protein n=1 Tax=Paenibacillus ehimensis TaxID=79264 RepID=UPI001C3F655B